jgi:hypothetical protein
MAVLDGWLTVAIALLAWVALQSWILPRLGVPT